MTRFPFFALPTLVLWTTCLCGDAYGQMTVAWAQQFSYGTPPNTQISSVSAATDSVYVTGTTLAALPGQTQVGSTDGFIRKCDLSGSELWTRQFGVSNCASPSPCGLAP